jgi:hypothetical protein
LHELKAVKGQELQLLTHHEPVLSCLARHSCACPCSCNIAAFYEHDACSQHALEMHAFAYANLSEASKSEVHVLLLPTAATVAFHSVRLLLWAATFHRISQSVTTVAGSLYQCLPPLTTIV